MKGSTQNPHRVPAILFHFLVVLKAQNNNPPRRIPPHMNNIIQADAGIINPFLLIYT